MVNNIIPVITKLIDNEYLKDETREGLDIVIINKDYILLLPGIFIKDNIQVQIKRSCVVRISSTGYYHMVLAPVLTSWAVTKEAQVKIVQLLDDNNYFVLATLHKTLNSLEVLNL